MSRQARYELTASALTDRLAQTTFANRLCQNKIGSYVSREKVQWKLLGSLVPKQQRVLEVTEELRWTRSIAVQP